ncbi:MAG TPA: hypothetical protein VEV41_08360 [Terriglobales bacterium]|nr:hypothetical protein [Terriglobales bacterium]
MKRLLLCLVLAAVATSWALAQDSDNDSKAKSEVRTLTGCLAKGDSADEFLLTASDGSTWEIHRNNAVNLDEHVGQEVSVTGAVSNNTMHNLKEDAKSAAADTHIKKDNAEHGHLKVTDVKKVSDTCKK